MVSNQCGAIVDRACLLADADEYHRRGRRRHDGHHWRDDEFPGWRDQFPRRDDQFSWRRDHQFPRRDDQFFWWRDQFPRRDDQFSRWDDQFRWNCYRRRDRRERQRWFQRQRRHFAVWRNATKL
jgi:hypothetical protein